MSQRNRPKSKIKQQPSNVVALGNQRDVTDEVPQSILMSYADMCIKLPIKHLDALVLTALHAKAFRLGLKEPQTIEISFSPLDGPYVWTDEELPDTQVIEPGNA